MRARRTCGAQLPAPRRRAILPLRGARRRRGRRRPVLLRERNGPEGPPARGERAGVIPDARSRPGSGRLVVRLRGRDAEKRQRGGHRRGRRAARGQRDDVRERLPRAHRGRAHRAARQAARERRPVPRAEEHAGRRRRRARRAQPSSARCSAGRRRSRSAATTWSAPPRRSSSSPRRTRSSRCAAACSRSSLIDAEGVKALASLPPRDVLVAQVVGTMAAPMTGLVTVLQGTISGFVRALQQVAEQKAAAGEA